jgi:hypothetical protein
MFLIIALTLGAHAQTIEDAVDDFTKAATLAEDESLVVEEAKTSMSAELGGQWTTGNAQLYTVSGGLTFGSRWEKNKLGSIFGITTGGAIPDSDGSGFIDETERDAGYVENARKVFGEVRYDRFVSKKDSIYGLVGAFHDVFSGFDLRSHEQLGYSRLLVNNDTTELRGEAGIDLAQEWRTTPEYANILAARLAAAVSHKFNDNVGISDTFELYENVIDTADLRLLNTAALTSTLGSNLSLKVSHTLIFDNVPVEGFQKFDQTFGINLVVSLL